MAQRLRRSPSRGDGRRSAARRTRRKPITLRPRLHHRIWGRRRIWPAAGRLPTRLAWCEPRLHPSPRRHAVLNRAGLAASRAKPVCRAAPGRPAASGGRVARRPPPPPGPVGPNRGGPGTLDRWAFPTWRGHLKIAAAPSVPTAAISAPRACRKAARRSPRPREMGRERLDVLPINL
jgi:hypothetical protein